MGLCSSCHRYDSVMIRRSKVISHPDGKVERYQDVTHKRDIIDVEGLEVEDLQ